MPSVSGRVFEYLLAVMGEKIGTPGEGPDNARLDHLTREAERHAYAPWLGERGG